MIPRKIVLTVHLYLGLAAGVFLVILGLTGSVMALEEDITHWLHPQLWYVDQRPHPLSENDLVSTAQNRFHARVVAIEFPRAPNLAQVMQMSDATVVYLNPYDGTVLGSTVGLSNSDAVLSYIHQMHLRLVPNPDWAPSLASSGKIIVGLADLFLLLLIASGLALWWRDQRLTIQWKATDFKVPWPQLFHQAHHVIGIYASFFLLIASLTGLVIAYDFLQKISYAITFSSPPPAPRPVGSAPAPPGATPLLSDQVLEIARTAMSGAKPAILVVPLRRAGAFSVLMRVPQDTARGVHSIVTIDQFSGKVLNVRDSRTDPRGLRLLRFNRSVHTGDAFGFPWRILASLSSLMLAVLVITGMVIWWKKLAVD